MRGVDIGCCCYIRCCGCYEPPLLPLLLLLLLTSGDGIGDGVCEAMSSVRVGGSCYCCCCSCC